MLHTVTCRRLHQRQGAVVLQSLFRMAAAPTGSPRSCRQSMKQIRSKPCSPYPFAPASSKRTCPLAVASAAAGRAWEVQGLARYEVRTNGGLRAVQSGKSLQSGSRRSQRTQQIGNEAQRALRRSETGRNRPRTDVHGMNHEGFHSCSALADDGQRPDLSAR